MFVTERAVFHLRKDGPVLTEIAPGLDLEREVLTRMDFNHRAGCGADGGSAVPGELGALRAALGT